MLGISASIVIGALARLLASYYRLRSRDLSINPIAERIANTSPDDTTPDTPEPSGTATHDQPCTLRPQPSAGPCTTTVSRSLARPLAR